MSSPPSTTISAGETTSKGTRLLTEVHHMEIGRNFNRIVCQSKWRIGDRYVEGVLFEISKRYPCEKLMHFDVNAL